jgi:hypothetical protein
MPDRWTRTPWLLLALTAAFIGGVWSWVALATWAFGR